MSKTYPRVMELLNKEVPAKISRNAFCRATGINPNSFDRYKAGISEPTTATLQKLADYFEVSVAELRGGSPYWVWELYRKTDDLDEAQKYFLNQLLIMLADSDSGGVLLKCIKILLNAKSSEHLTAYLNALENTEKPLAPPFVELTTMEDLKDHLKQRVKEIEGHKKKT